MKFLYRTLLASVLTLAVLSGCSNEPTVDDLNMKATQLFNSQNAAEALAVTEQAIAKAEMEYPPDHPIVVKPLLTRALIYQSQKNWFGAESSYHQAISILEKFNGIESIEVAMVTNNLAGLYYLQNDFERALSVYQESLEILKKKFADDSPQVQQIRRNIKACLAAKSGNNIKSAQNDNPSSQVQDLVPPEVKNAAIKSLAIQSILISENLKPMQPVKFSNTGLVFPYRSIRKFENNPEADAEEVIVLFSAVKKMNDDGVYNFKQCRIVSYQSYMEMLSKGDMSEMQTTLLQLFPDLLFSMD